ncbi:MAG TPA: LamG-like jellyroll fold domain-containing protein [Steroidobacteraceae bacterium]
MNTNRLRLHLLLPAVALLLAACSGGAPTTQNAEVANNASSAAIYTGPAPASADVEAFKVNLWQNINMSSRCGGCHKAGGQSPMFARSDDVNLAYSAALSVVNLTQPDQSPMVLKVGGGHNCWLSSPSACADILTTWIQNWAGGGSGGSAGSTQIQLTAPVDQAVGPTKQYPADSTLFSTTVYPLLTMFCSRCHSPSATVPQSPYFASSNVDQAYAAAQPKINLNTPNLSRFYVRLATESHNCWATTPGGPVDCAGSAARMLAAIQGFANAVQTTPVDPSLVVSRALTLTAGTIASGENRYDADIIARWLFKENTGTTAFDTSGVDPAINLTISGNTTWDSAWGLIFGTGGAKAQGSTATSSKIYSSIAASGQYSLELWAAPANVTQTMAFMGGYSGGTSARNFTLAQDAMQYQAYGRTTSTDANGAPPLTTAAANMNAQAALQHIVLTYDSTHGRQLYINGNFTGDVDPVKGGTLANWDNTFAWVLGNETSNDRPWQGEIRFAAVHKNALNIAQIQQNYAAGVGQVFYLLFDVSALTGVAQSYIMVTASQYDNYSYLLAKPTFISLNPKAQPGNIPIAGMYIGMNGQELQVGQAFSTLNTSVTDDNYSATGGQLLSSVGTVVPLQLGPNSDLFFLSFDRIGTHTHTRTVATPVAPAPTDLAPSSDIGLHVYDEINASMAAITGVSPGITSVNATYLTVQQQLPTVPDIQGFLPSQEIGISQLSIQYCSTLVDTPAQSAAFFPGLNLNQTPAQAFGTDAGMDLVITPLINSPAVGIGLASQPTDAQIRTELYSLMTALVNCNASDPTCVQTPTRTHTIAKAACATVLGSATMLIK